MAPTLQSKLEHGRQRFLAYAIEHALEVGRRTPEDFIRHFPPKTIMQALSLRPDLRADLLVPTTGLKHRIALKKSWQSAGDDIQSALDEGETKAIQIVQAFAPDDRVLYLEDKQLWAFIIEGQFWKATAKDDKATFAIAQQHVAYLVERALLDGLITARDVIDGIGVSELCNRLPRSEMASLFTAALEGGRASKPFTDQDLLGALPPATLVQHVPLAHIYETVLNQRVAKVHGYLPDDTSKAPAVALPGILIEPAPVTTAPPAEAAPAIDGATLIENKPAEAAASPASAMPAEEPKTNGNGASSSRRRSKAPPGEKAHGTGAPEDDTEWIEIPESAR